VLVRRAGRPPTGEVADRPLGCGAAVGSPPRRLRCSGRSRRRPCSGDDSCRSARTTSPDRVTEHAVRWIEKEVREFICVVPARRRPDPAHRRSRPCVVDADAEVIAVAARPAPFLAAVRCPILQEPRPRARTTTTGRDPSGATPFCRECRHGRSVHRAPVARPRRAVPVSGPDRGLSPLPRSLAGGTMTPPGSPDTGPPGHPCHHRRRRSARAAPASR